MKTINDLKTILRLTVLAGSLALLSPGSLNAVEPIKTRSLFNNLPERAGFSGHWGFPTRNRGRSAQQFMTNELGAISTISFASGAKGNPTGTIALEIWDDDEGFPNSKVAGVGLIDLDKLTPREEGGELLTYHVSIDGLEPNSPYYLVQINAGAQIDSENTFVTYLTSDANGTGGSEERMIHPGQWEILTTFNPDYPLSSVYTVLRITAGTGDQESSLYDNFPTPVFTSENTIFPQSNRGASAQPFRTGEHGLISSIGFNTSAKGNPSGTVSVELWDDEDGKPGTMIAQIGTIDLATLPSKESGGKQMTFTGPFTDLKPNSVYYLVINNAATVIDADNSYRIQVTDKSGGFSRGSGELLLKPDDWVPANSLVSGLGLSSVFGVFEITESSQDIPEDTVEISSIERGASATILNLQIRPFVTYALEFSESLAQDGWIEIDDSIESAGGQITYEDTDPERRSKARGFYRLRKTTID